MTLSRLERFPAVKRRDGVSHTRCFAGFGIIIAAKPY